jgi:uncharacterized DUF497 family protein
MGYRKQDKSHEKHGITCEEAESVFNNINNLRALGIQTSPEVDEVRYGAFGKTDEQKSVFMCFTLKERRYIRIISIRALNRKENVLYEKLCEK